MLDSNNNLIWEIIHRNSQTKDAFCMAEHEHRPHLRDSGEPYIDHPVSVANQYLQVSPNDEIGLTACLLHDIWELSSITLRNIEKYFGRYGEEISFMVGALSKRPSDQFSCREDRLKEYYSRFFPASLVDKRIPLIKSLDRLHNVQTIDPLESGRGLRILNETVEVLLPFFKSLRLPSTQSLERVCQQKLCKIGFLAVNQK